MSVMDNIDDALTKAADHESKMLAATDDKTRADHKRRANLYFKRAMKNDGHENYDEHILA